VTYITESDLELALPEIWGNRGIEMLLIVLTPARAGVNRSHKEAFVHELPGKVILR
jgi:hypothetical protein